MLYDAFKKELLQLLAMVESEKARKGIAVAFSGGSDSVALLHLLLRFGKEQQLPIYAVHVEHGIRGQTSLDDADFAKSFCRKLAVPLEVVHIDVPGYVAKNSGVSVEEAAKLCGTQLLSRRPGTSVFPLFASATTWMTKWKPFSLIFSEGRESQVYGEFRGSGGMEGSAI